MSGYEESNSVEEWLSNSHPYQSPISVPGHGTADSHCTTHNKTNDAYYRQCSEAHFTLQKCPVLYPCCVEEKATGQSARYSHEPWLVVKGCDKWSHGRCQKRQERANCDVYPK
jgi:hypothetical protein